MESRVNRYDNDGQVILTRTKKNAELYKKINEAEIDNFDVFSNTAIIETNNNGTINVDKLRDMLDKKYREEPKKVSLTRNLEDEELRKLSLDETREYDINELLNKAKVNEENDYEVERLKKVRNTEVDILKGLDIDRNDNKNVPSKDAKHLVELINTINLKETIASDGPDPLDILSDLKGDDDNTKVLGAKDDFNAITKEAPVIRGLDKVKEEPKVIKEDTTMLTKTNVFTESDFDDFNDLKEEVASTKIIIKILIVIVVIAFIVGIIFILNKVLGLGLF